MVSIVAFSFKDANYLLVSETDSTKPYLPHSLKSKELLTAKEVRSVLRCSNQTILGYRNAGQIAFVKINQRRFLYSTDSLVRLLSTSSRLS